MDLKVDGNSVICFDLDDTIYNELDYLKSAYLEISNKVQNVDSLELFARMFSMYRSGSDVFEYLESNYSCNKEKLIVEYREHFPRIEPFDGVIGIFEKIKKNKGKLCLITDGRSLTQRNKIKALNIESFFDKIVISEELGTTKPNENNFMVIETSFPGLNYCYIADNFKKDFVVPNKRNWYSIGVLDNGKNIHNNAFTFFDKSYRPQTLVTHVNNINII